MENIQNSEDNLRSLSSQSTLTEISPLLFAAAKPDWMTQGLPRVLLSWPSIGSQIHATSVPVLYTGSGGTKLRSSSLHGKLFTHWAISAIPVCFLSSQLSSPCDMLSPLHSLIGSQGHLVFGAFAGPNLESQPLATFKDREIER